MTQGLLNSEELTFLFIEKKQVHLLLTITFTVIKHEIKVHVFAITTF